MMKWTLWSPETSKLFLKSTFLADHLLPLDERCCSFHLTIIKARILWTFAPFNLLMIRLLCSEYQLLNCASRIATNWTLTSRYVFVSFDDEFTTVMHSAFCGLNVWNLNVKSCWVTLMAVDVVVVSLPKAPLEL